MIALQHLRQATVALGFVTVFVAGAGAQTSEQRDLLSFAQGALPVSVDMPGTDMRVSMSAAIGLIDGNPDGFTMIGKPGTREDSVILTYALPAPTRFSRLAVPTMRETPSPSQTMFARIEISGAIHSPDGPYLPLAEGTLARHQETGQQTELALVADPPEVRWVRARLSDGMAIERDRTFFESPN